MKIAIVRRECGFGLGGAEGYCENVAKGLSRRGHEVTVISRRSLVKGENISHVKARVFGRGSIAKNLSFFWSVSKILKGNNFDCVYGLSRIANADILRISDPLHAAWLELGYEGRFLPKWLRSSLPRHISLIWQEKKAITSARYIVTNSNLVKNQLVRYYKVDPSYITVIYNGVDLSRFSPLSLHEKRLVRQELGIPLQDLIVLFTGSDPRRKGFEVLLQAVAPLVNTFQFHLAVAGFTPTKAIKVLINRLGLEEKVIFLGIRQDIEKIYGACDLLCLPTSYDPFANVCLEAMACGLPVITTSQNGASELIKEVEGDWVIPGPQEDALKNVLETWLLMDSQHRQKISNSFVSLASKFGFDYHLERLDQLLGLVALYK